MLTTNILNVLLAPKRSLSFSVLALGKTCQPLSPSPGPDPLQLALSTDTCAGRCTDSIACGSRRELGTWEFLACLLY